MGVNTIEEAAMPKVNDFVVVKFYGKKSVKHYVALVLSANDTGFTVKYLRKSVGRKFVFPQVDDVAHVDTDDIIHVLECPLKSKRGYSFGKSISNYENVC